MGMIGYLFNLVRSKPVTIGYPAVVTMPERGNRGTPVLTTEGCELSGACQDACPTAAIQINKASVGNGSWQIDYGLCIFCGACVEACPERAIVASDSFELAVRQRPSAISSHAIERRNV
jgi:formate hydrogenlyase subunit 6/NADH:ubiquinone oxidoreductase subunit I